MKIEHGALFEQPVQNEPVFAKAKATTSFSKTAAAKADSLGRSTRPGQPGYAKDEVAGRSAIEEFEALKWTPRNAKTKWRLWRIP